MNKIGTGAGFCNSMASGSALAVAVATSEAKASTPDATNIKYFNCNGKH